MPTKKEERERETAEAIDKLRGILAPGDTVYTVLRHVSRSGMYRAIDLYVMDEDDTGKCYPRRITFDAARATGDKYDTRYDAIGVGGCGMDMGFAVVYGLSRTLYRDGFACIGQGTDRHGRCPANDHSNDYYDHDRDKSQDWAPTRIHKDGGYAINQQWL